MCLIYRGWKMDLFCNVVVLNVDLKCDVRWIIREEGKYRGCFNMGVN